MLSGFSSMFKRKMVRVSPSSQKIKFIETQNRKYSAWKGASIVSQMSTAV